MEILLERAERTQWSGLISGVDELDVHVLRVVTEDEQRDDEEEQHEQTRLRSAGQARQTARIEDQRAALDVDEAHDPYGKQAKDVDEEEDDAIIRRDLWTELADDL